MRTCIKISYDIHIFNNLDMVLLKYYEILSDCNRFVILILFIRQIAASTSDEIY